MLGAFKRKSRVEVLEEKYRKLQNEICHLTDFNEEAREKKTTEARSTLKEIETIKEKRKFKPHQKK